MRSMQKQTIWRYSSGSPNLFVNCGLCVNAITQYGCYQRRSESVGIRISNVKETHCGDNEKGERVIGASALYAI